MPHSVYHRETVTDSSYWASGLFRALGLVRRCWLIFRDRNRALLLIPYYCFYSNNPLIEMEEVLVMKQNLWFWSLSMFYPDPLLNTFHDKINSTLSADTRVWSMTCAVAGQCGSKADMSAPGFSKEKREEKKKKRSDRWQIFCQLFKANLWLLNVCSNWQFFFSYYIK